MDQVDLCRIIRRSAGSLERDEKRSRGARTVVAVGVAALTSRHAPRSNYRLPTGRRVRSRGASWMIAVVQRGSAGWARVSQSKCRDPAWTAYGRASGRAVRARTALDHDRRAAANVADESCDSRTSELRIVHGRPADERENVPAHGGRHPTRRPLRFGAPARRHSRSREIRNVERPRRRSRREVRRRHTNRNHVCVLREVSARAGGVRPLRRNLRAQSEIRCSAERRDRCRRAELRAERVAFSVGECCINWMNRKCVEDGGAEATAMT